jgi:mRNA-degrading endonuclease RelE of RelBE toxin-antitoxin system
MIDYSFTKHTHRQFRKLPLETQRRIIKKIKFYISTGNPLHFADFIKGEKGKVYRFRIGDWRIIFDWLNTNGKHIRVIQVKPRPKAY